MQRIFRRGLHANSQNKSLDVLKRAYLYVPSSAPRMLAKSVELHADTIIYDLEDSVAEQDKPAARKALKEFLNGLGRDISPSRIAVRINGADTSQWKDDIMTILSLPNVSTLVVPKVHDVTILNSLAEATGTAGKHLDVIACIESAKALWNVGSIAVWKPKTQDSGLRVHGLLFGAEDYCADARVQRTPSGEELLYTRSHLVTAARAHGLHAIDMVCVDYKDAGRLLQESQSARRLGFSGKQAIHPSQVETIQRVFLPTPEELNTAVAIVEGMKTAALDKRGAFGLTLPGTQSQVMIDAPMLKQAENILEVARAAGLEIPRLK